MVDAQTTVGDDCCAEVVEMNDPVASAQEVIDWTAACGANVHSLRPFVDILPGNVAVRGIKWCPPSPHKCNSHHEPLLRAGDILASIPSHVVLSERICMQSTLGVQFARFILKRESRWKRLTRNNTDVYAAGLIMFCGFLVLEKYVVPELIRRGQQTEHLVALPYSCQGSATRNESHEGNVNNDRWQSYCRCYYPGKFTPYVQSLPETFNLPIELLAMQGSDDNGADNDDDLLVEGTDNIIHSETNKSKNATDDSQVNELYNSLFSNTPITFIAESRLATLRKGIKFLRQSCSDLFEVEGLGNMLTLRRLIWAYCAISSRAFPQDVPKSNPEQITRAFDPVRSYCKMRFKDEPNRYDIAKRHISDFHSAYKAFFSKKSTELCLYPALDYINHRRNEKITWNIGTIPNNSESLSNSDISQLSKNDCHNVPCNNPVCGLLHAFAESQSVEFVTQTETPISVGSTVYNNYGSKGNENLLSNYGFVMDENPEDYAKLTINVTDSSISGQLKRDLLNRMYGTADRWIYMIFENKSNTFGFDDNLVDYPEADNFKEDIFIVSRVITCTDTELQLLLNTAFAFEQDRAASSNNETDADNSIPKKRKVVEFCNGEKSVMLDDIKDPNVFCKVLSKPLTARNELSMLLSLRKELESKMHELGPKDLTNIQALKESNVLRELMREAKLDLDYIIHAGLVYRKGQTTIVGSNVDYIDKRLSAVFCTTRNNAACKNGSNVNVRGNEALFSSQHRETNQPPAEWYVPESKEEAVTLGYKVFPVTLEENGELMLTSGVWMRHFTFDLIPANVLSLLRNLVATEGSKVELNEENDFDELVATVLLTIEVFVRCLADLDLLCLERVMNAELSVTNSRWKIPFEVVQRHCKERGIPTSQYESKMTASTAELNAICSNSAREVADFYETRLQSVVSTFATESGTGFGECGSPPSATTFAWGYDLVDKLAVLPPVCPLMFPLVLLPWQG